MGERIKDVWVGQKTSLDSRFGLSSVGPIQATQFGAVRLHIFALWPVLVKDLPIHTLCHLHACIRSSPCLCCSLIHDAHHDIRPF